MSDGPSVFCQVHPWNLTWNLKSTQLKRKIIFQTSIFRFHVKFQGSTVYYCSCESTSKYQILVWRIEVWLPGFLLEVSETHWKSSKSSWYFCRRDIIQATNICWILYIYIYIYIMYVSLKKEHHPSKSYLLNLIDIMLELWWVNSVKVMLPFWARLVSYGDRLWQNNRYKSRGSKSSRRGGYECCHAGECPDGGNWQEQMGNGEKPKTFVEEKFKIIENKKNQIQNQRLF